MKIILTEQQFIQLVLTERVELILAESLTNKKYINNLKNKIKNLLLKGIAITSIIAAVNQLHIAREEKFELLRFINKEKIEKLTQRNIEYEKKVEACRKYMLKALSNQGYSENSTRLTPEAIVRAAERYSFDLPLLIAAAHYESCFGATPRAKRTNSVYSVGAYDSGKDMVSYAHPDDSIEGYIKLLRKDYLVNGKTINDILKPGCFVNKNGKRYASRKNYEKTLNYIRNKIINQYPELK